MSQPTLPYSFARRFGVVMVDGEASPRCLHRGLLPLRPLLELQRVFGPSLVFEGLDDEAFERRLQDQYRDRATAAARSDDGGADLVALADSAAAVEDLLDQRDDSPVVRLINAILLQAARDGASDVHVEAHEQKLLVRFRVDGVLRDVLEPRQSLTPMLVSRIKVMARLDIAEKRTPQDGRVSLRIGGTDLDVRVSTIPSRHGERVVMRLLDRDARRLNLDTLGMTNRDAETFRRLVSRPHGVVLVTGPTGAGKTTTLYAALNHLNDRRRNIMTVEDPIEYALEGVGQMQVNEKIDLTFARGLRAILRQDPDVIMVGEIRDQETAEVAVRASMTGHLVLSTLHTNSAVGSVTRLADMGVERYLLAPMIVGFVAQRLVRRLCETCRAPGAATSEESALLNGALPSGAQIFHARGCPSCVDGFRGRAGIYEVVEMDETLRALVHDGAAEAALTCAARERGPGLLEDGVAKILAGHTSVEEVLRVVREAG
jgi:general secretion pathway protein E